MRLAPRRFGDSCGGGNGGRPRAGRLAHHRDVVVGADRVAREPGIRGHRGPAAARGRGQGAAACSTQRWSRGGRLVPVGRRPVPGTVAQLWRRSGQSTAGHSSRPGPVDRQPIPPGHAVGPGPQWPAGVAWVFSGLTPSQGAPMPGTLDLWSDTGDPGSMPRREEPSHGILDPVAKMLRLPFGTPEFIDRIVTGGVNQVGRRTLRMLITTWDAAGGGPFAASAIASTGMAKTAEIVQSMFVGPVFGPLLKVLGADKAAMRASLCASQLVGLGIMRYGIRSEPLHSMSVDMIVDAIGPTMQRYLVGDITK